MVRADLRRQFHEHSGMMLNDAPRQYDSAVACSVTCRLLQTATADRPSSPSAVPRCTGNRHANRT